MEPTLRRADDGDIEILVDFMRQHYAGKQARFDESFARTSLEQLVTSDALGSVYLVQQDEAACGYVAVTLGYSLRLHGPVAWVDELIVAPPLRRRETEQSALRFICDTYAQAGIDAVLIALTGGDEGTAQAAHALGFRASGHTILSKRLDA